MPLDTREKAARYIDEVKGRMHLLGWDLRVSKDAPESPDALATVRCIRGRQIAWINLSDDFLSAEAEEQRYIAVHELVHVHFALSDEIIRKNLTVKAHQCWEEAVEYAVDRLASVIAPYLPLPK